MGTKIAAAALAALLVLSVNHVAVAEVAPVQPDPALSFLPDPTKVDWGAVTKSRAAKARTRSARADAPIHAEREAVGAHGANDTPASAEFIQNFGTRKGKTPRVTLLGDLAPDTGVPTLPPFAEDNGSVPLAGDTGVQRRILTSGVIGDGPHGSAGDGTGDFDFYRITGGTAGFTTATITTDTPTGDLDTVLGLYNADGQLLIFTDNTESGTDSRLVVPLQAGVVYYVLVSAAGPSMLPRDAMDSGSGTGIGSEGPYGLTVSTGESNADQDFFAVDLRAGDVIGASVAGAAKRLAVHDGRREVFGSSQDASGIYSPASPLPGGGNAVVDFVAPRDGRYTLGVQHGEGKYEVTFEVYRPGAEVEPSGTVQTLFLDFDGARVNTAIFGGPGVRQLSPFANFLSRWGLTDQNAVIDAVVASVRENFALKSTNPRFAVRILNSRDHADPFGQPNVTRLVIGGTVAESGINTIGIAQSIDPGNFGHEETALVLLDYLSDPAGPGSSLNTYLTPASNRTRFVGTAIGNVIAHEAGHLSGNWHQDQFNSVASLMDQGGNPAVMFGVGPDGVGGTADDVDVDFAEDVLNPGEGFAGVEDTVARTAWAYSRGAS